MKTALTIILAIALSGCQVLGGWVGAHQAGIVAAGTVAYTVNQVESATLNGIELAKKAKAGKE